MQSHSHSALEASVLVLNKLFMAVHVISVRRAFCLLCKDLAEVVSLEDGQFATYNFQTWREVSEYRARHFRHAAMATLALIGIATLIASIRDYLMS